MRAMKTKYQALELYQKNQAVDRILLDLWELMAESWDLIQPYGFSDILQQDNIEKRRALFTCLNPATYINEIKDKLTLVDKETLIKTNTKWDADNKPYTETIEDTYELYSVLASVLLKPVVYQDGNGVLYLVRCWCTSTGREYWIFVDRNAFYEEGESKSHWRSWAYRNAMMRPAKAVEAIAWTFRIGVPWEKVKSIKRQGDLLLVEVDPSTGLLPQDKWYHLTADQYKEKLVAES